MRENVVAAVRCDRRDKYELLEEVLERGDFLEVLEERRAEAGKSRADFRVAVKVNLSMMLRRADVGTYTDPFLVVHLLRWLLLRGYENLVVVESQNLYGNWFERRSVVQVGARAGFYDESVLAAWRGEDRWMIPVRGGGVDAEVPLVDLTLDTLEEDLGGAAGVVPLGREWVDADFRVSMAKLKSHFYSHYTLAIKNVYGALPMQDKVRHYHCKRAVGSWTALLIHKYPVHFCVVDAYSAADGLLGVKMKAIGNKTHTLLAGEDILAVDHYGAKLMGIRAEKTTMYKHLARLSAPRPYKVEGNAGRLRPWRNIPWLVALFCAVIESSANLMDWMGALATGGYDRCFPHKKNNRSLFKRALYWITQPVNILLDVGFLRLRFRKRRFFRKIRQHQEAAPILCGSPFLLRKLAYLSPGDMERLADLLEKHPPGPVSFSGHYLFFGKTEAAFPARLSPAVIAAAKLAGQVYATGADARAVAAELRAVAGLHPQMFGKRMDYAYCYR
ncbi:MAG: DUF362 domain-containing protein [Deltaproteobacteria bacterium]|nr:DUF362 domain-containing protein [Deltaproteobacteria bacterium]